MYDAAKETDQHGSACFRGHSRSGAELLDTLASVNNLRLVLLRQGKYNEAEVMHRRALEAGEKVFATVSRHAHQRQQPWVGVVEPGQVRKGRSDAPARPRSI